MSVLSARGLARRFGGVVALDGVDLEVALGEVVGLLGPNGAGKTTLFNCLSGVEHADRGTVRLDGLDVSLLAAHQRARMGMARTFQRVELFDQLSVRDHVAVAARSASRRGRMLALGHRHRARAWSREDQAARVAGVLDQLGLLDEAHLPAAALSLGRVRLVELARALVVEPVVILADEPSSGLDDPERRVLASALRAVSERGTAVVLIEHDLDLVRRVSSSAYVIDAGVVVASGSTDEVLSGPMLSRIYGRSGLG
ncbi:MAG: ABC transporter ATP-binding protein [Acidimicrobiales bacterium]